MLSLCTRLIRIAATLFGLWVVPCSVLALDFNVTSPNSGDYLGKTNKIKFIVTGATSQIKAIATTTYVANPATTFIVEGLFDPQASGEIDASLPLNFDESTPEGLYNIDVKFYSAGVLVTTKSVAGVTVDTKRPRLKDIRPAKNAFVKGVVPIRATVSADETNLDTWRVRANGNDIPSNTGTTSDIAVDWDTSSIEKDGAQSININVKDLANNSSDQTFTVTLDRVAPIISITSPANIIYRPGATIPVVINVQDQFSGSVMNTGVDVILQTTSGQFIAKVSRISAQAQGNTLRWTGRIKGNKKLPKKVKLVVTAVDRAGNIASSQQTVIQFGGK